MLKARSSADNAVRRWQQPLRRRWSYVPAQPVASRRWVRKSFAVAAVSRSRRCRRTCKMPPQGGLPPRQQIIKRPLKMHTRRRAYRHLNHRHLQPTACHRACRKYPHGRRQNRMLQNPAGGRFGHGRLPAVCSPPSALRVGWCTRES